MMPLLVNDLCEKKHWFSMDEIAEGYALAQSLPGPIATNVAVFFGEKRMGLKGAIVAAFGAMIPAIVAIIVAVWILDAFNIDRVVSLALSGIKSASIALICHSAYMMVKKSVKKFSDIILFVGLILVTLVLDMSAYFTVIIAASFGIFAFVLERVKCGEK